jgi:seryl-tRNA synthetase
MLSIDFIRDNPERVRKALHAKGHEDAGDDLVGQVLTLDEERREKLTNLQDLQHESNEASERIGELMRQDKKDEAQDLIDRSKTLKQRISTLEDEAGDAEKRRDAALLRIPNVPHESVPVGHSPDENETLREEGEKPSFDFEPQPHWALAERHDLIAFERGAKVTGAGFPFYLGKGARLQRALVDYFLDLADERGYREMQPPLFANADSARGTGQLPDKEDLMYEIGRDELFPIPTAEVPVTNFFRDEILDEDDLPLKFCAYTPCFRREAGSYGKDVRGLNRLHQFDKVELVRFERPESSYDALEELLADAERPLRQLGLPYRVLLMCTGDMGFTQAKKYDLEVWSAGQERWLEVSSVSNFTSYQARRLNARCRSDPESDTRFVHTLNGSGLALPRVVAALIEQNQQADGTLVLPDALAERTDFKRIGGR